MELRSFAKINLMLAVLEKRSDGYHELISVITAVDLHDTIRLDFSGKGIEVVCTHPQVPDGDGNLAFRAVKAFAGAYGTQTGRAIGGIRVNIEKRIPVAAGLGGGSSNAACVLDALNGYYGFPFTQPELMDIGLSLGADVPFFLFGKAALATGVGEKLKPFPGIAAFPVLLVNPGVCVSTAHVFKNLDFRLTKCKKKLRDNLLNRQDFNIPGDLCNDLEVVTAKEYPDISRAKQSLLKNGAVGALMSGSGPTVFGLFSDEDSLRAARRNLDETAGWRVFQTAILP